MPIQRQAGMNDQVGKHDNIMREKDEMKGSIRGQQPREIGWNMIILQIGFFVQILKKKNQKFGK